ncbi:MAG TPA: NfeD family protein [Bauldia sp.]|nr:NfeD family protein [Bauldia sp.]
MILDFIRDLGAWAWWVGGAILLALEIIAPGNVFVWFGIAAILTGAAALVADIAWQFQLILFAVLSLILVIVGRRYFGRAGASEEPLLNERATRLVGQSYVLGDPIVDGTGRIRIGDTVWRLTGPDLPSGTKVRIVGHDGSVLQAAKAEG